MSNSEFEKKLTEYFISGDKSACVHTLGVEIEHIICNADTMEAVPYFGARGIEYILNDLASYYPTAMINSNGPMLGFSTDNFNITVEPAAQLEISIYPMEKIDQIKKIYSEFMDNLLSILTPLNMTCETVGYQPKSKVSDIPLIPKVRYELMDKYFKTSGTMGINMMRGTASVQVSIDYSSEDDFKNKFKSAYFLSPYFKYITDNCPVFEGETNDKRLLRSEIWNNVDKARSGIIPGVLSDDFGFEAYSKYILNMPTIFLPSEITGSQEIYTENKLGLELAKDYEFNKTFIAHLLSMAFPDVRLKSYIEIRYADSMPMDKMLGYSAYIKGVFYNEKCIDYIINFIKDNNITEDDIVKSQDSLSKNGPSGNIYGIELQKFHETIYKFAYDFLDDNEREYLKIFSEI